MANLTGRMLGRYQLLELLGEGGMAAVYRAYDTHLERYVAVKVLHAGHGPDPSVLRRFQLEARALAQLAHPAIVRVLDYGEEFGQPFLVLEYVQGGSLKEQLPAGRPWHWRDAAGFLAPVARALEAAHRAGIIHRDVKPGNILINENGQPLLSDFGIAKTLQADAITDLTAVGVSMGTPDYMSPEQCTGQPVDYRTDIYSLGIVFYEMVVGRKPFPAESGMAVMHRQVYDPLPSPRQFVPDLPRDVEAVLYRALAKNPAGRFATMGEFAAALEALAQYGRAAITAAESAPATAPARTPATAPAREVPATRRGKPFPWGSVFGLVVGLALVVGLGWAAVRARPLIDRLFNPAAPQVPAATQPAPAPPTTAPRPASTSWQQGRMAFIQREGGINGVYLLQPSSGDSRLLYAANGRQAFGAAWSPDGSRVAYYVYPNDLRVLDVNAEDSSALIGSCNVPAWSGGGDRIICRDANRAIFYIVDANGAGVVDQFEYAGGAVPAWSPARGDEIAFAVFQGERTSIWRMSLETRSAEPLASEASENYAPAWSPDGEQIAYQSNLGSDNSEIWVMDREGGGARRVTNSPAGSWSRAPSWSPDGRWLAFVSSQAGSIGPDYGEIFVVSLESGEVIQVSQSGGTIYDWRVSWGP